MQLKNYWKTHLQLTFPAGDKLELLDVSVGTAFLQNCNLVCPFLLLYSLQPSLLRFQQLYRNVSTVKVSSQAIYLSSICLGTFHPSINL